jgi:hypothetical protein
VKGEKKLDQLNDCYSAEEEFAQSSAQYITGGRRAAVRCQQFLSGLYLTSLSVAQMVGMMLNE